MESLTTKIILDEPAFMCLTQVGHWLHVLDYETGAGDWVWDGDLEGKDMLADAERAKEEVVRYRKERAEQEFNRIYCEEMT